MAKQEVTIVQPSQFALMKQDNSALKNLIKENMGALGVTPLDLDRVRVPAGGGTAWEVPSLEGTTNERHIDGVIAYFRDPRSYWSTSFEDQPGTPPSCSAADGMFGVGVPGGECAKCALAQFGSATPKKGQKESRGQACRQMRFLFVVTPERMLPIIVVVPPTSLKEMRKYFLRLASEQIPYYGVVSRFALKKTKNKDGIEFSEIVPAVAARLDAEQVGRIRSYAEGLKGAFETVQATAEDAHA